MTIKVLTATDRTIGILRRIKEVQGFNWFNMQLHRTYHDNSITLNDVSNMLNRGYLLRSNKTGSVRLSNTKYMREALGATEEATCLDQLRERKEYQNSKRLRELVPPPSSLTAQVPFIW